MLIARLTICKLHQIWEDREERKNWILPINDGRTGTFRTHGRKPDFRHAGEGLGRLTFRNVDLA
jgi:hypothetical protein